MICSGRGSPRSSKVTALLALVIVLLPFISNQVSAGDNVAGDQDHTPLKAIEVNELWRIGGDSNDDQQFFGLITDLSVDNNGFVYIVDQQLNRCSVYAPDGSFVRRIGNEGDGPGEFRQPYRVFMFSADDIAILSARRGRIHCFARSGEYHQDIPVPTDKSGIVPILRDVKLAGNQLVALGYTKPNVEFVQPGERSAVHAVCALNNRLEETLIYYSVTTQEDDARPIWSERPALEGRWDVGVDGRVFVATDFLDYKVAAYRADGTLEKMLTRAYKPRRRSRGEKQRVLEWATINPNGNLPGTSYQIEDYDKAIMSLYVRDDGSLWVLTSRGFYDRPEGSLGVFDIFEPRGEYSGQISIIGEGDPSRDRYFFRGDRLYVVTCFTPAVATMVGDGKDNHFTDSCDEPMAVICYNLASSR